MDRRKFLSAAPAVFLPVVSGKAVPEPTTPFPNTTFPVSDFGPPTGASIQSALDTAQKNGGGVVVLDDLIYQVHEPIVMRDHRGTVVRGMGSTVHVWNGTSISWQGEVDGNVFEVEDCRNCLFEGFSVNAHIGKPASAAFLSSNGTASNDTVSTANRWNNVHVQGGNGGIEYGWRFSGYDANNDFARFDSCEASNYSVAGWSFEHSQSKAHAFIDCRAYGNGFGQYGVATQLGESGHGGSFHWRDGFMHGNTVADFGLGTPNDAIIIDGLNSEHSAMLADFRGPTGAPWPVSFRGVRWDSQQMATHGKIINCTTPGPLVVDGCMFYTNTAAVIHCGTWARYGSYTIRSCYFRTETNRPIYVDTRNAFVETSGNLCHLGGEFFGLPS